MIQDSTSDPSQFAPAKAHPLFSPHKTSFSALYPRSDAP